MLTKQLNLVIVDRCPFGSFGKSYLSDSGIVHIKALEADNLLQVQVLFSKNQPA